MNVTGRSRPVEDLLVEYDERLGDWTKTLGWCWNVTRLHVSLNYNQFKDLFPLPEHVLPVLKELSVEIQSRFLEPGFVVDVSDLLASAGQKQLRNVSIGFAACDIRDIVCSPLSVDTLLGFSEMRVLDVKVSSVSDMLHHLSALPASSWPHLTTLNAGRLNDRNVMHLMRVAPALKQLNIGVGVLALPLVAHCCQNVAISNHFDDHQVKLHEVQAAFEHSEINSFEHLIEVRYVNQPELEVAHFLCSKFNIGYSKLKIISLCETKSMVLWLYLHFAVGFKTLRHPDMYVRLCTPFRTLPDYIGQHDKLMKYILYDDQRYGLLHEQVTIKLFDMPYHRFSQDEDPMSTMNEIDNIVSNDDKLMIDRWTTGDYSSHKSESQSIN